MFPHFLKGFHEILTNLRCSVKDYGPLFVIEHLQITHCFVARCLKICKILKLQQQQKHQLIDQMSSSLDQWTNFPIGHMPHGSKW